MILQDIVKKKRLRLEERKKDLPLNKIIQMAETKKNEVRPNFFEALKSSNSLAVIAEVKKASPSKGVISKEFDYLQIAMEYENCGASCISVLTEEDFFLGSDKYMTDIIQNVSIPVIRKDFVTDEYQIYESKLLGASSILLICRILNDSELRKFYTIASELGLDCLVEAHDEGELKRAVKLNASIIGINNRNLDTFDVSLDTSKKLINLIPDNIITISESGISSGEDMERIKQWGFDGVLVGESLMRSNGLKDKFGELIRGGKKEGDVSQID